MSLRSLLKKHSLPSEAVKVLDDFIRTRKFKENNLLKYDYSLEEFKRFLNSNYDELGRLAHLEGIKEFKELLKREGY
ncbi:MAG: hypothetical protein LBU40_02060 [Methanobrevibacter sp.]|nr:hypothetical protein [Methanobrevibacter sp.]